MGNMSYCRMENTAGDLEDCKEALERLLNAEAEDGEAALSKRELQKAKELVATCQEIMQLVAEYQGVEMEDVTGGDIEAALDDAQAAAEEADKDAEEEEEAGPSASMYLNPEANR